MADRTESAEAPVATAGISRRRVLTGVAWATPAILVATSSPPAAASGPGEQAAPTVPGDLGFLSSSAVYTSPALRVRAQLAYLGTSTSAPVTGTQVTVTFGQYDLPAAAPTNVAAGWQQVGTVTRVNNNATFTFAYVLGDITDAQPAVEFAATFSGWQTWATVQVKATGTSLTSQISKTVSVLPRAVALPPTLANGNAIRWEEWFISNPKTSAFRFDAAVRWNTPQNPVGADLTGVTAVFRIPDNRTDGTMYPDNAGIGAGWTLLGGQGSHEGAYWYFRFALAGSLGEGHATSTPLQFAVKATGTPTAGAVQYTISGSSAGVQLSTTGTAP